MRPLNPAPFPCAPRPPLFGDLALGDRVRAFAGLGTMLVVDLDGRMVTAACRTPAGVTEVTVPRILLRKVG